MNHKKCDGSGGCAYVTSASARDLPYHMVVYHCLRCAVLWSKRKGVKCKPRRRA